MTTPSPLPPLKMDETKEELERERKRALNIIDEITGKTPNRTKKKKSNIGLLQPHYDPSIDKSVEKVDRVSPRGTPHNEEIQTEEREVSIKPFYDVAENLTNAFTKKKKGDKDQTHQFNFLSEVKDGSDDSGTDNVHETCIAGNPAVNTTQEDETMDVDQPSHPHGSGSSSFLFFFHASSPELRNRLDDSTFFRTTFNA